MTGKLGGASVLSPLLAAGDRQEYPAQKSPLPVFTTVLLFSLRLAFPLSYQHTVIGFWAYPGNEGRLHLGLMTSTNTFP